MFNPFYPLSRPLLDAFVRSGKKYFVRQSFPRGKDHGDEGIRGYFIFTHYAEIGHAQHHLGAISQDPYRFLYEWDDPAHRQKLYMAAGQPAGFKIYSGVFNKDWEKQVSDPMKGKAKDFIETKMRWKPGRGDTVNFNIYVHYGELYATIKFRGQEVRVKLKEIENYKTYLPTCTSQLQLN